VSRQRISPEERAQLIGKYPSMDHDLHGEGAGSPVADQIETGLTGTFSEYSAPYADHPWAGRYVPDHLQNLHNDFGWLPRELEQTHGYQEPFFHETDEDGYMLGEYSESGNYFTPSSTTYPGLAGWEEGSMTPDGDWILAPPYTRSGIDELPDSEQPLFLPKGGGELPIQARAAEVARDDLAAPCLLWWSMDTLGREYRDRRLVLYPVSVFWTPAEYARALLRRALRIRYETLGMSRLQCDRDRYDRSGATDWNRMGKGWKGYARDLKRAPKDYVYRNSPILLASCGATIVMAVVSDKAKAQCDAEGSGISWFLPGSDDDR